MIFIELFTHKGALSTEQRHLLSKRLIEVLSEESAPAEVIEAVPLVTTPFKGLATATPPKSETKRKVAIWCVSRVVACMA